MMPERQGGKPAAEPRRDGEGAAGAPYRSPELRHHGRLTDLVGAAEGTEADGAGGFFALSGGAA